MPLAAAGPTLWVSVRSERWPKGLPPPAFGTNPTAEEVSGDFPGLEPTLQDHRVLPSKSSHTVHDKGNKTWGDSDLKPKCWVDAPGHRKGYGRKNATIVCHRYWHPGLKGSGSFPVTPAAVAARLPATWECVLQRETGTFGSKVSLELFSTLLLWRWTNNKTTHQRHWDNKWLTTPERTTSSSKLRQIPADSPDPGFFSSSLAPEEELVFGNQARTFSVHTEVISMRLSQMHVALLLISKQRYLQQ